MRATTEECFLYCHVFCQFEASVEEDHCIQQYHVICHTFTHSRAITPFSVKGYNSFRGEKKIYEIKIHVGLILVFCIFSMAHWGHKLLESSPFCPFRARSPPLFSDSICRPICHLMERRGNNFLPHDWELQKLKEILSLIAWAKPNVLEQVCVFQLTQQVLSIAYLS